MALSETSTPDKLVAFTSWNGYHQFRLPSFRNFLALQEGTPQLFDGSYVFRGQEQALWRLDSGLARMLRGVPERDRTRQRREHLMRFCRFLRREGDPNHPELIKRTLASLGETHAPSFTSVPGLPVSRDHIVQDEVDIWSIGQHHGLATPLLDWTRVPIIALFFAGGGGGDTSEQGDCAIFALNTKLVEKESKEARTRTAPHGYLDLIEPIAGERNRIIAQDGLFSISSSNIPVERWVTSTFKEPERKDLPVLLKFIFPSNQKEILKAVKLHGITHDRMMPDLDGISKSANFILSTTNN